jgi:HSP20 family molecular chaperone IbpA
MGLFIDSKGFLLWYHTDEKFAKSGIPDTIADSFPRFPMFKFFNVGHSEDADEIDVRHDYEGESVEEDVGQVALDVVDLEDSIVIVAPLAGISVEDADIAVSRNVLTISGERKRPQIYTESGRILVEECFFGPFSRSVVLPENLAFNKIRAQMENNLLIVAVPKLQFPSKSVKIDKLES